MHSVNNELVKAGHDFAAAISNDTPIIEIAKMVSRLAAQLDVTTLALREKSHEVTAYEATVTNLEAEAKTLKAGVKHLGQKVQGLAAENSRLNDVAKGGAFVMQKALMKYEFGIGMTEQAEHFIRDACEKFEATDAALAEMRNEARADGIYFTANRMLAAWDAGFINSPAKEVIDVARMILSAADMLKDATQADFSRKFADEIMAEMATELRKEQGK